MRSPRSLLTVPLVATALLLASCGGDSGDDTGTTVATTVATSPPTTAAAPETTVDDTSTTEYVPDTTRPPETAPPGPTVITVTVGVDSDPTRIERAALGDTVTLVVTNPAAADEFHLHGYDLGDGQEIPAGQAASFTFTASQAGEFELESHETDAALMVLVVE